ncbi:hypothetical protein GBA52_004126 [Prunus armeniaca]|nr:hypothetical protein GBA52_004126 [Prunus armeniaca]
MKAVSPLKVGNGIFGSSDDQRSRWTPFPSSSARTSSTTQSPPPNSLASSTTPTCPSPWRLNYPQLFERLRVLLLDTSRSHLESIRAGGRYDFIVEHDVKELRAHT